MKQPILACILAASATATALAAPVATLRGTIIDPVNHRAVGGAEIEVRAEGIVFHTQTNNRGAFALVGVPAGHFNVAISADGYSTITVATCAEPNEMRNLPLFVVPQLMDVTNARATQQYYAQANNHDSQVATAPHITQFDQYTAGYCDG